MFTTLLLTLAFGLSGFLLFVYFWQRGQFQDTEETKYQVFRDEDHDM